MSRAGSHCLPPAARRLALSLTLVALVASNLVCHAAALGAEAAPAASPAKPKPKVPVSPEVEAKLAEFVKKVEDAKRRVWNLQMQKEIEAVAKATGLGEVGRKALADPAKAAVDQCVVGWASKIADIFRGFFNQRPEEALPEMDQIILQADFYASNEELVSDYVRPEDHPLWTEALKRTLTPEQAAAWDRARAERDRAIESETDDLLKIMVDRTREQFEKSILPKSGEVKFMLALPKEQAAQVSALMNRAVEESVAGYRKVAEKALLSMNEDQRRQVIKNRQFYVETEAKNMPAQGSVWNDGLKKLLSPEQERRWAVMKAEQKARRIRILARMMVAELDDRSAFTAKQREQLQPIAERLVQASPILNPGDDAEMQGNLAAQTFYAAGAGATEAEMKPILDSAQWTHWRQVCSGVNPDANPAESAAGRAGAATGQGPADPVDPESAISDFLYRKAAGMRAKLLGPMLLKAEDAARIAQLPPESVNQLEIAARGAGERSLSAWKSNVEQMVRNQIGDVTAQNVKQRLTSIDGFYFDNSYTERASHNKQPFWESTVKTTLTPEQAAAWQKEVDARRAYRDESVAMEILVEFDLANPLTSAQWDKLGPLLHTAMKDYGPDIDRMFSSPWYEERYSMFIPLAFVPEKDFKAVLTQEQWDTWVGSPEYANSANYSQNVVRMHDQRAKEKK